MKKSLTIILLTISLSGWAQEIPIEFFAGDNYNTIDIRFARHFKNSERFSIFSKNVIYSTWDNETSVNAIQNLNYSITHHFGLITAVQFKSSGVASRNGIRFIDHGKNQLRVGQFLYEFGPKNRLTYLIILRQLNPLTTNWQWVY